MQACLTADTYTFRRRVLAELRNVLDFEVACFTTVDPRTLLSTGAVTDERIEKLHPRLFENEYEGADCNRYSELAHSSVKVAALSVATGGNLAQSVRGREILLPAGLGDELRAALVHQGECWGFLTLYRSAEQARFTQTEIALVSTLVPNFARTLREATTRMEADAAAVNTPEAGIAVISADFTLLSANDAARWWLAVLRRQEDIGQQYLPRPVRAVCSKVRGRSRIQKSSGQAKVCIPISQGGFLSIRASELTSPSTVQYAVVLERARPDEIVPLLAASYNLTSREKQLLGCILSGGSTKEIAAALSISTYTVQDHLKSIFSKTGVGSRRELIRLLITRYSLLDIM